MPAFYFKPYPYKTTFIHKWDVLFSEMNEILFKYISKKHVFA